MLRAYTFFSESFAGEKIEDNIMKDIKDKGCTAAGMEAAARRRQR